MIKCKINGVEAELESRPSCLINEQHAIDGTWRPGDGGWFPLKIIKSDAIPHQKDYVIDLDNGETWSLCDVKRNGNELQFNSCWYERN